MLFYFFKLTSLTHKKHCRAQQVESLRSNVTATGGNTPMAEAVLLAYEEFQLHGDITHVKLVMMLTDGVPNPLAQAYETQNLPSPWSYPYPSQYYGTVFCQPNCLVDYNTYLGSTLPGYATSLKNYGAQILVLTLPSNDNPVPDPTYFAAIPTFLNGPSCNSTSSCAPNCNWCGYFSPQTGGTSQVCQCTVLAGPIVSNVSTDIFTTYSYDTMAMVQLTRNASCYIPPPTSSPTSSPSKGPTFFPTFLTRSPTVKGYRYPPSNHPTTAHPSKSPVHSKPTKSPTSKKTISPTHSKPTKSPSTSYPTKSPSTAHPSKSPTTSHPTKSPTTTHPTVSPTTSHPSKSPILHPSHSPITSKPSISPTKIPSAAPTFIQTFKPSSSPASSAPSKSPHTSKPTTSPSFLPTKAPITSLPTKTPSTSKPTKSPTLFPSFSPTSFPTFHPTHSPTNLPTTFNPTHNPTTSTPTKSPITTKPTYSPRSSVPTNSPVEIQ